VPLPSELLAQARQLLAEGKVPHAEHLCRQALEQAPHDADGWFLLGSLSSQGKAAESIPAYQRALSVRPEWAEGHFRLGQALDGQGQRDQAGVYYQRALRLAPDHAEAELRAVNEAIWEVEDGLRARERAEEFGATFIDMGRSVYRSNAWRSALKPAVRSSSGVVIGNVRRA
jgi:tetratricopeptide (TPR) repeat protein